MQKIYKISREALRNKDFKTGSSVVTSASKCSTEKIELFATVLKELVENK